jgi:hypothetical protein
VGRGSSESGASTVAATFVFHVFSVPCSPIIGEMWVCQQSMFKCFDIWPPHQLPSKRVLCFFWPPHGLSTRKCVVNTFSFRYLYHPPVVYYMIQSHLI